MAARNGRSFWTHLVNIGRLMIKELRSFRSDPVMLLLVIYSFTVSVYTVSTGAATDAVNLSVGVVDEDHSRLSAHLRDALLPPVFQPARLISARDIDSEMDHARLVFVLEIPPRFEQDLLAGRPASVQINVDATAMTQAGIGSGYLQSLIQQEVANTLGRREMEPVAPVNVVVSTRFNPNLISSWFTSVMQVINTITMLTVILTGAALIREREQGTIEHLLVMPLVPSEIMLSKILANGLIVLVAAGLSLILIVEWLLDVPIAGSIGLFLAGTALYCFTVASLGILLGTIATTMGQFGLLAIPILIVLQLLSGSSTPMESMPVWLQYLMRVISPTPHFVEFAQSVLYRGAGLSIVVPDLAAVAAIAAVYLTISLRQFRRMMVQT